MEIDQTPQSVLTKHTQLCVVKRKTNNFVVNKIPTPGTPFLFIVLLKDTMDNHGKNQFSDNGFLGPRQSPVNLVTTASLFPGKWVYLTTG